MRAIQLISLCILVTSQAAACKTPETRLGARRAASYVGNIRVVSAEADAKLQALFEGREGWTGADGAGTVKLEGRKILWMFGNSFIGRVRGGKREKAEFVNNSAAWQSLNRPGAQLEFFYRNTPNGRASSLVSGPRSGEFYCPCDGQLVDNKLYLFMRRVSVPPKRAGPFDFSVVGCDLLVVSNPLSKPTKWVYQTVQMPFTKMGLDAASCCFLDGTHLYVCGRVISPKPHPNQLAVARIAVAALSRSDYLSWQYLCDTAGGGRWQAQLDSPQILFDDASPEMTVCRWPDIAGWTAIYMPPCTDRICMRQATHAWGPWSAALILYKGPAQAKDVYFVQCQSSC
jgi:hypothetical protein